MISKTEKDELENLIIELGHQAEKIKKNNISYRIKDDMSPLSEADSLINERIIKFLNSTEIKNTISEENKNITYDERCDWDYFWLIDPVDGTKEFIKKGNDYTLNVALCKKEYPIFSIVYAPARKELYRAELNEGAWLNGEKINANRNISKQINVVASKSHLDERTSSFIDKLSEDYEINIEHYGSSLKICKIAEGNADIYPRFGPTMEWDTCAAHLILKEAGGEMRNLKHECLKYNKENLKNPYFIASCNINFQL